MNTKFSVRITAITMAMAMFIAPAQAGFLDDFYEQSGATTTMTPAGVYQGQSATVVSGGALSMRVPNRSFNPITFSPPNFSAGCGGIDLYLGAFGFPTGAEMTAFLRNVGQASGGIAFSVALKALSPELDATISHYSEQIRNMVSTFRSSCQAAQQLMDGSGANLFIHEMVTNAKKGSRLFSSDATVAEKQAADLQKAKENAVKFSQNNPNAAVNPERNVVWEALNSGDYGSSLTETEKIFIMGLTGTVKFIINNYDDQSEPQVVPVPPVSTSIELMISQLIGNPKTEWTKIKLYICGNKETRGPANYGMTNNCLITSGPFDASAGIGIRYRLETAKEAITQAMRSRTPLDTNLIVHYATLNNASTLPLLKIVQAAASRRNQIVSDQLVSQYLEVASAQIAISYLRSAVNEVSRGVTVASKANSEATRKTLSELTVRANEVSRQLDEREKLINAQVQNLQAALQLYESTQRFMQSSLSTDLTRSMNYGK